MAVIADHGTLFRRVVQNAAAAAAIASTFVPVRQMLSGHDRISLKLRYRLCSANPADLLVLHGIVLRNRCFRQEIAAVIDLEQIAIMLSKDFRNRREHLSVFQQNFCTTIAEHIAVLLRLCLRTVLILQLMRKNILSHDNPFFPLSLYSQLR